MSHIDTKNLGYDSKLVHAGAHHDAYGSATVPIYQTSTFAFDNAQQGADRFAGTAERLHLHAPRQPHHQRARAADGRARGRLRAASR